MNRIEGVLFDLDGTLLDSAPDLVGSLNWVRKTEGLPPLEIADMSQFASKGAVGLLQAGMPAAESEVLETRRLIFLEHYGQNSFKNSRLYDGVTELLEFLHQKGIPWGIVTNKTEILTRPIITAADLDEIIGCIVCGDTLAESKPHPAPVILACDMLRVEPGKTLFVGDDIRDIEAGRAAGTQTAAALYGYGSSEMMEFDVGDSLHIRHPADLIEHVCKVPSVNT